MFESSQSYYDIFQKAGISWKKTQKSNPRKDPELVEKKLEITAWLDNHFEEIISGKMVVFIEDECQVYA